MEYTLTITINLYHVVIACGVLFAFGCLYNRWVEHLEGHGHDRGYMGFIVALGCTVTITGFALATHILLSIPLFACFAASGIPMIVGSVCRHIRSRELAEAERDHQAVQHLEKD